MITKKPFGICEWRPDETYMDPVGTCVLANQMNLNPEHIELWSFSIAPSCRNQGYGQQMLREIIEDVGDKKVVLFVEKTNDVAVHIYHKFGFEITGEYMRGEAWKMTRQNRNSQLS